MDHFWLALKNYQYSHDNQTWLECSNLYNKRMSKVVRYIGRVFLSKTNAFECEMYQYKGLRKTEKKYRGKSRCGNPVKYYRKSHKEGWLLVTSITYGDKSPSWIVKQYQLRMKIELEFRASKNARWGLGLEYTATSTPKRLEILLLIGAIALFALWLIGLYAENKSLHYDYQANTTKSHRVLSLVFLGLQVMLHDPGAIRQEDVIGVLQTQQKDIF